jgi:hypothetical protein
VKYGESDGDGGGNVHDGCDNNDKPKWNSRRLPISAISLSISPFAFFFKKKWQVS